eukprot:1967454-Alexandrium_andersonii.AAC.1
MRSQQLSSLSVDSILLSLGRTVSLWTVSSFDSLHPQILVGVRCRVAVVACPAACTAASLPPHLHATSTWRRPPWT